MPIMREHTTKRAYTREVSDAPGLSGKIVSIEGQAALSIATSSVYHYIRWKVKKSTTWSLVCVLRLKQFGGNRNAGKVLRSQWIHWLQPHHTHIGIQLLQVMHRVA